MYQISCQSDGLCLREKRGGSPIDSTDFPGHTCSVGVTFFCPRLLALTNLFKILNLFSVCIALQNLD